MRRGLAMIGVCCLCSWTASGHAGATNGQSAHDLVAEALRTLDYKNDFRTISGFQFSFRFVKRDIVEGEHAGEPYIVSIGSGSETDDLGTGYQ